MRPQKRTKKNPPSESIASPQTPGSQANDPKAKPNIRWNATLLEKLACAIARDYIAYKTSNKIEFGRKWSLEIGVAHLDDDGERTKSKAGLMLKKWTETYECP
jgi:hypothetical protein